MSGVSAVCIQPPDANLSRCWYELGACIRPQLREGVQSTDDQGLLVSISPSGVSPGTKVF